MGAVTETLPEAKARRVAEELRRIGAAHSPAVLASSLGAEDMVLTDLISREAPGIAVFSLDTGRLNAETYELMQQVKTRYPDLDYRIYAPEAADVEALVQGYGPNAFYESLDLRKQCCHVRKVKPLQRALAGNSAWITGMRRLQSVTRKDLEPETWDEANGLYKFNPLYDWSQAEVWGYIRAHGVPYNALHEQGYASVGCAPCTRPIAAGEDERAGRWWWEDPEAKECGLHLNRES
ncbi:phosphoadenylyl-sulfate reductase [Thiohalorhabdus methylotrophus]|uniref:Adenosine 5'-phosphosulfate reductase n=1 Tax=Thiohalorhabdus methylotrophus TaxID=3242694 RepID=A0ABV4TVD2_9GAMM